MRKNNIFRLKPSKKIRTWNFVKILLVLTKELLFWTGVLFYVSPGNRDNVNVAHKKYM